MCGGNEDLKLQQTKQAELRAEIRQQLSAQQTWDLEEGQTIGQRRTEEAQRLIVRQQEVNEQLNLRTQSLFPPATADSAAAGSPLQTTPAAEKSWKRRREDAKRTKEAQKHSIVTADHVSYAINRDLTQYRAEKNNSLEPLKRHLESTDMDPNLMRHFLHGHKTDKKGRPLNDLERQKKEADQKFIEDYSSKDIERRKPHLQRITRDIFEMKISADLFREENLEQNSAKLREMSERLGYFKLMMNDPINAPFFEGLTETDRVFLTERVETMGPAFEHMLALHFTQKGLQADGEYINDRRSMAALISIQQKEQLYRNDFNAAIRHGSEVFDQQLERELEVKRQENMAESDRLHQMLEEQSPEMAGLDLTAYAIGFTLDTLSSLRTQIESAPEQYKANQKVLDHLYQRCYRANDALGDINNEITACQKVAREHQNSWGTDPAIKNAMMLKLAELDEKHRLIQGQIQANLELIGFYLRDEPLTESARIAARQEGLLGETRNVEQKRLLEKVRQEAAAIRQTGNTTAAVTHFLQNLTFSADPIPLSPDMEAFDAGLLYMGNKQKSMEAVTLESARLNLKAALTETFGNPETHGGALEQNLTNASGLEFSGLNAMRLATDLTGALGQGYTIDQIKSLYEKLLCCGRYNHLKLREKVGSLAEDGKAELAGYKAEDTARMNSAFAEGIRDLKQICLAQLRRLRDKYGTLPTQLHPEDFAAKIGPEFFDDLHLDQDVLQLFQSGDGHPEYAIPEEEELRTLNDYYHSVVQIVTGYFQMKLMGPESREYYYEATDHVTAKNLEKSIGGPGLDEEEESAYLRQMQERFADKPQVMIFGRFDPAGDLIAARDFFKSAEEAYQAKEQEEREAEAEAYAASAELFQTAEKEYHASDRRQFEESQEGQLAASAQLFRDAEEQYEADEQEEALLKASAKLFQDAEEQYERNEEEQLQEEAYAASAQLFRTAEDAYAKTPGAADRVKERLTLLDFNKDRQRTSGMDTFTLFKIGQKERTSLTLETMRGDLPEVFEKHFASHPGYSGGDTGSFGNATGSVLISGFSAQRTATILKGAFGGEKSTEELLAMYEKLLCGCHYRELKKAAATKAITPEQEAELNSYTEEQLTQLDTTFDEGMLELKQLQLDQLRRLRDKYGRWPTQLHPQDFADRIGLEFFDDISIMQDITQMMADGKKYFDFENSAEDREYRDLADYYFGTTTFLFSYGIPDETDPTQKGCIKYSRSTHYKHALELEQTMPAQGFSPEEQEVYDQQVRQRIQQGEKLLQLDRFKSREQLDAEAKAMEAEEAAKLKAARHRTREEATKTHSDILSESRRNTVNGLALRFPRDSLLRQALTSYYAGTRYKVGYTEERRLLQVAIKTVNDALGSLTGTESAAYVQALNQTKAYFADVTNGTLVVPEGAAVMDFSKERPKEEGTIKRGSFRNGIIRGFNYWSDQTDTPLFSHEPTVNDLKQRMVSNCYMVAGTAGLVNVDPAMLKSCIRENEDNTVTVRLYQWQEVENEEPVAEEDPDLLELGIEVDTVKKTELVPIYVKVSKEIPRIAGADALSAGALWMQMIEKACAFVGRDGIKGYKSLWYGEGGEFLERLLGISPQTVYRKGDAMSEEEKASLFNDLCSTMNYLEQQDKLTCKTQDQPTEPPPMRVYNTGTGSVGKEDGLNAGHAYTIMGGKQIGDKRYVLLRNPYSTMSLQYQEDGTKTRTGMHLDTRSDATYGQFYMEYEEFLQKFEKITCTDLSKAPVGN